MSTFNYTHMMDRVEQSGVVIRNDADDLPQVVSFTIHLRKSQQKLVHLSFLQANRE